MSQSLIYSLYIRLIAWWCRARTTHLPARRDIGRRAVCIWRLLASPPPPLGTRAARQSADRFDQDIDSWDTGAVKTMQSMFSVRRHRPYRARTMHLPAVRHRAPRRGHLVGVCWRRLHPRSALVRLGSTRSGSIRTSTAGTRPR